MTRGTPRTLNLDQVSIDGLAVHRLSATLQHGDDDPRAPAGCPWWVYLACDRMPEHLAVGPDPRSMVARLVDGRTIHGQVRIAQRRDDGYGTVLIMAGVGPLAE